ncbi:MAG: hypothetical protein IJQ16_01310 [Selenomonadaceae bacterium]|nr:hypothetical protein [Selenomonadaceae bacterium]
MMKKFFMTAALVLVLGFSGVANAMDYEEYLNGDKNRLLSWSHDAEAEYAVLDSVKIIRDDKDSYEISIQYEYSYTGDGFGGVHYEIRFFRQNKDGKSLPQYSMDMGNTWIIIPSWKDTDAVKSSQNPEEGGNYNDFTFKYIPVPTIFSK